MTARFLFLLTEGFSETVIDSQVVDTLAALRAEGLAFDLLALCDGRDWLAQRSFYAQRGAEIARRTGARVGVWPIARKLSASGLALALPTLAATLGPRGLRNALVHCRGEWASRLAAHLGRAFPGVRFVYDCRGDAEAEYERDAEARGVPAGIARDTLERIRGARALARVARRARARRLDPAARPPGLAVRARSRALSGRARRRGPGEVPPRRARAHAPRARSSASRNAS